jgi:5-methylcytosine-specific restriction endonuclease McrA
MYQITIKYIKVPKTITNGHKIYQHLKMQDPPKFTQICIFGLKIHRLTTPANAIPSSELCRQSVRKTPPKKTARTASHRVAVIALDLLQCQRCSKCIFLVSRKGRRHLFFRRVPLKTNIGAFFISEDI